MTPFFECMTPSFNEAVVELKEGMTKVMRTIKKTDSSFIEGQRIYYNHLREHQTLGKTPAQAAGLELDLGVNKWESLIKKAAREPAD